MNDDYLNQILEETLQHVITNHVPSILDRASQTPLGSSLVPLITDLSLNGQSIVLNTGGTNDSGPTATSSGESDISFNTEAVEEDRTVNTIPPTPATAPTIAPVPAVGSYESQTSIEQARYIELLDDYTGLWFRYTNEYQENMRLYHQNIAQMNRVSQSIIRNIGALQPPREPAYFASTRETPVPSHVRNFLQQNGFGMELQGFSIPIRPATISEEASSYPNVSQVIAGTDRFRYGSDTIDRVNDTRCPISLEDFTIGEELCEIRHCGHIFKWSALRSWFSRNSHCPVCRYDIRQYVPS